MKFGAVSVADALGATAVHSIRQGDFVLKKGTRIGPAEIAALTAAGVKQARRLGHALRVGRSGCRRYRRRD